MADPVFDPIESLAEAMSPWTGLALEEVRRRSPHLLDVYRDGARSWLADFSAAQQEVGAGQPRPEEGKATPLPRSCGETSGPRALDYMFLEEVAVFTAAAVSGQHVAPDRWQRLNGWARLLLTQPATQQQEVDGEAPVERLAATVEALLAERRGLGANGERYGYLPDNPDTRLLVRELAIHLEDFRSATSPSEQGGEVAK